MRAASEAGSYSVPLTQEQKNWFLNGLCLQNILGKIHSLLTNKVCYCLYLESQCSMSKTNCMNWEVHEFLVLTSHILCASIHCSISTLRFILVSDLLSAYLSPLRGQITHLNTCRDMWPPSRTCLLHG